MAQVNLAYPECPDFLEGRLAPSLWMPIPVNPEYLVAQLRLSAQDFLESPEYHVNLVSLAHRSLLLAQVIPEFPAFLGGLLAPLP